MRRICLSIILALCAVSCIQNDLPLPYVEAYFKNVEGPGISAFNVDRTNRILTLTLFESTPLDSVAVTKCEYSDPMVKSTVPLPSVLDLRQDISLTLSTYQEYKWTIVAKQEIERYFTVQGQLGATSIDPVNHRAIVQVAKTTPLSWITTNTLKFGPDSITTYNPDLFAIRDFRKPVQLAVSYNNVRELWTIYVEQSDKSVIFESVSPRTRRCFVKAQAVSGAINGFLYRQEGEKKWSVTKNITESEGVMTAEIDSLSPLTNYECLAFSGQDTTETRIFTTEDEVPVPNGGFEYFSHAESQDYYSFYDPASDSCKVKWWDSGNKGSTTAGPAYTICDPDTKDFVEGKASAHLISRNVIIKFAAGNLFAGQFGEVLGVKGGTVYFGEPFTRRPSALKIWIKYNCGAIDCISEIPSGMSIKEGDPDIGQVYVALGDWNFKTYGGTKEHPVCVNTTDKSTLFNPDGEAVIAYGTFTTRESIKEWTCITIPLEYHDNFRVPTHIIISCASSALGDYFTGSSTSDMHVDNFTFEY